MDYPTIFDNSTSELTRMSSNGVSNSNRLVIVEPTSSVYGSNLYRHNR